jgi:hypothetical protein
MSSPTEILATWMGQHGFATGHGDTLDDMLGELEWQVGEIRDKRTDFREQRDELLAALRAILPWHDPHPIEQTNNPIINQCRIAIAKAEGQS